MLGFSFPLKSAAGSVHIEFTRTFYAVGLIIAITESTVKFHVGNILKKKRPFQSNGAYYRLQAGV